MVPSSCYSATQHADETVRTQTCVSSLELQTFGTITMRDDDSDRGHDNSKPYLGKAYGKLT